jgi:hypothetical protein
MLDVQSSWSFVTYTHTATPTTVWMPDGTAVGLPLPLAHILLVTCDITSDSKNTSYFAASTLFRQSQSHCESQFVLFIYSQPVCIYHCICTIPLCILTLVLQFTYREPLCIVPPCTSTYSCCLLSASHYACVLVPALSHSAHNLITFSHAFLYIQRTTLHSEPALSHPVYNLWPHFSFRTESHSAFRTCLVPPCV